MLYSLLIIVDVLIALAIIGFILLQQGKGATAGAAFGSGASSTVFGSRGSASFMTRTTAILATLFFLNSLGLAMLANNTETAPSSVVDKLNQEAPQDEVRQDPVVPAEEAEQQETVPQETTPEDLPE